MTTMPTRAHAHVERPLPPLAIRAWLRWDVVARHLESLRPGSVLEVGCGLGAVGSRIARRSHYLGLEPDPVSFEAARKNIEPHGGEVRNLTSSELRDAAAYDLVCAFEVLEHIEHDEEALLEWRRFVRPGGHLLISVPAFQRRFGPMDALAGHFRRYDPDALERLLGRSGFDVVETTVYGWPLGYALEAVHNRIHGRRLKGSDVASKQDLTSASGRILQPRRYVTGLAIRVGTLPFRLAQRHQPNRGVGLVVLARRRTHEPGSGSLPI